MSRFFGAGLGLLLLLVAEARADRFFLDSLDAPRPPRAEALALELEGALLFVTPGELDLERGREITPPPGTELYLLEPHDPGASLDRPADGLNVVGRFGGLVLAAADPEGRRTLEGIAGCRQRLGFLPAAPAAPTAVGKAAVRVPAALKDALVESCDLQRYTDYLRELSGDKEFLLGGVAVRNGDRYTFSPNIAKAEDYLRTRLLAMGYPVTLQSFPVYTGTARNVVAVKAGTVHPDSVVVVGAHYDAIASNLPPRYPAPGAEDNGSGTAAVLLLAEVFADYETEKTVHFVLFGAEEQGLFGSQHYVSTAVGAGQATVGALTMDMIAAWETNYGVTIEGGYAWEPLMFLFRDNLVAYTDIAFDLTYRSFGSDHVPFQQAGIPAFLAIDQDWARYDHYHESTDTFDKTDPTLGLEILKGMAGALADLAVPTTATSAPPAAGRLVLEQNRPNPFNPVTVIAWRQAEAGAARLEIFDVAGRRIRLLRDGPAAAGAHEAFWDGRDDAGRPVASGLYLYRLRQGARSEARRMILAR